MASLRVGRLILFVAALALPGCFSPDKPTCSYACADTSPKCPESYECRTDGYCHLTGTTTACLFSDAAVPLDMSVATVPDMVSTPD
ncbi:MAG: hypothetical protein JWN44_7172 [Myxococcales bacterium]|nr:hypothetical protein [Myxococcales bacterium]